MTAFSFHYSKKIKVLLFLLSTFFSNIAYADNIRINSAEIFLIDEQYTLAASYDVEITKILEEILIKGVPLNFLLEFDLIYPNIFTLYLFNKEIYSFKQKYRLSFNSLTQQYRLSFGGLYQNHTNLKDAMSVIGSIRKSNFIKSDQIKIDAIHEAQIRLSLDITKLPKPLQMSALGNKNWNLNSGWFRWTLTR